MNEPALRRRGFLTAASTGVVGAVAFPGMLASGEATGKGRTLAILGGEPVRKNKSWPSWPYWDENVVESVAKTTKSRIWCRIQSKSGAVPTFEKEFAELLETEYCVATGSGTQALHTCVEALQIGPGDEVITSPYTDPGTIAAILCARALPVLADLDPDSFQLDPDDVERRVTENTKAIMDQCYTVHNHGTSRKGRTETIGSKYRMNEFEAAVLLGQLPGVKERFARRNANVAYLASKLKGFPGVVPQKLYEGTQSGAFYVYGMTYRKEHFNGASRDAFLKAVRAEGISLGPYIGQGLHKEPWVENILNAKVYQRMFSAQRLKEYREQNECPHCDQVCQNVVAFWSSGILLGEEEDMDDIVNAIFKVHENRDKLPAV